MNDIQHIFKGNAVKKRQTTLPLITELSATKKHPEVYYRMVGDMNVLVEYGKNQPDLAHRFRVDAIVKSLEILKLKGVLKIIPGIRSFMVRYNPFVLSLENLLIALHNQEKDLGNLNDYTVKSRIIKLPIAYNHSIVNQVIEHYMKTVKRTGPHLPDNLGFIAKCNGIVGKEKLIQKHASTDYMVLGGAGENMGTICGFPLDPRIQFVVPKYNPIRTWTPEGSVGLGGPFLKIYPVDSPGGSQLMGRTIPLLKIEEESQEVISIIKPFDRIRFYEVEEVELEELREEAKKTDLKIEIAEGEFNLSDYKEFLSSVNTEAQALKREQKEFFKVWTKSY